MASAHHDLIISTTKEIFLALLQSNDPMIHAGVAPDDDRTSKTIEAYGDRFKSLSKKVAEAYDELQ